MDAESPTLSLTRAGTLVLVLALVTVPLASVAAQETDSDGPSYVAVQNGQCTPIASFAGDESVRSFYDYRSPFPNNPYTNATGDSYSSEGTTDLQRANTSVVFLYTDTNGTETVGDDRRSLVFVHGAFDNDSSAGGAVTFNVTGLPDDGRWAVKDDEYDDPSSYDNWSADSGDTAVDWTWSDGATDGGAYVGLDDDSAIAVEPSFNQEAALFGQYYNGTVDSWQVVSNESADGADVTRTELDRDQPLYILAGSCADFGGEDGDFDVDIGADGDGDGDGARNGNGGGDGDGGTVTTTARTTTATVTTTTERTTTTTTTTEPTTTTTTETETTTTRTRTDSPGGPVTTTDTETDTTAVPDSPDTETPGEETPPDGEDTPVNGDETEPDGEDTPANGGEEPDGAEADGNGENGAGDEGAGAAGNGEADGADDDGANGNGADGGDGADADGGDGANGANGGNGANGNGGNGNGGNGANGGGANGNGGNGNGANGNGNGANGNAGDSGAGADN